MALADDMAALPVQPGVYLMKDAEGTILYVGKAAILRQRVRSYFQPGADHSPRIQLMVKRVVQVDFKVTATELEALVLEANLIKEHQPRYNVRLRDDKRFPYLKLTAETFPRLVECREPERDGARYFGPYVDAGAMRAVEQLVRRLYKIRSCTFDLRGGPQMRPCLDYHLGLCDGACAGLISAADYNRKVDQAAAFLRGETSEELDRLESEMQAAAEALEFERASQLRDLQADVRKVLAEQRIVSTSGLEADVFAVAQHDDLSCVQMFQVRSGKVLGDERVVYGDTADDIAGVPLRAYLLKYYAADVHLPPLVLLSSPIEDPEVLADWLGELAGRRIEVSTPERGERRQLVELVQMNAADSLRRYLLDRDRAKQRAEAALTDLRDELDLPRTPFRIECYDIATLQGGHSVGSLVVLSEGRPSKKDYRRFAIRASYDAPNDYEMMREVLTRRLERAVAGDPKFLPLPDLLVVDGGQGQLGIAREVTEALGLQQIPLAALAKRHEYLFRPDRPDPLVLEPRRPALRVLRLLRDEAHRFANTYHQKLRRRSSLRSVLDDIPGIGPRRRTALLSHFRSTDKIAAASLEALAAVPGMNRPAAEKLKAWLAGQGTEAPDQDED